MNQISKNLVKFTPIIILSFFLQHWEISNFIPIIFLS